MKNKTYGNTVTKELMLELSRAKIIAAERREEAIKEKYM